MSHASSMSRVMPAAGGAVAATLLLLAGCGGDRPESGTAVDGSDEASAAAEAPPVDTVSPVVGRLTLPAPDSTTAEVGLSTVRAALELQEEGRPRAAGDSLAAAARRLPPAADWIRMGRASAAAVAGDTGAVRALLDGLDAVPSRRHEAAIRVTAWDSAGDPAGAARLAARRAEEARDGRERSGWLLRAARLHLESADTSAARGELRRAARAAPAGRPALESIRELEELGALSAEDELLAGRTLAARGAWWKAHPHFRAYLDGSSAGGARRDSVRLEYGRTLLRAGRYLGAVEAVEALADGRGAPGLVADALLVEGTARLRYRAPVDGRELLEELIRRHPTHPAAGEAVEELASRAEDEGDLSTAGRRWAEAARHAASAREAEVRLLQGGTLAYLAGAHDSAASIFRDRGRSGLPPGARQRGVYWMALALRASGDERTARELLRAAMDMDRYSYYGARAAELLGLPLLPADLPAGPRTPGDVADEVDNAVLRLRVAKALGFEGAVERETERLEDHFLRHEFGRYVLAEALVGRGFPLRGVRVGLRIRRDAGGANLRLLRILYPFPRREAIRDAAHRHGMSPYLLAGLIRQESLFETEIESYAGAVGLMQIMPGTGRDLAREHGPEGFLVGDLRRPAVNLRLGTAYLDELMGRFDGRLHFGLAAYNAGPHRVERWRRRPYAGDPDVFLEHVPFSQTRHYVKAVLGGARVYAALYGCGRSEPCLGRRPAVALDRRAGGVDRGGPVR